MKSRIRRVVTLAQGPFDAREVFVRCRSVAACPMVGSSALAQLVPPRQRHGYDLVVHVGLARYLRHRQREEIRTELMTEHGIELSSGTVSNLCDRFLVYLEALHLCRVPHLRAAMTGGYPLHVDVTCDKGKGGVAVCVDGWRNWVLVAGRVPTENTDDIRPIVDQTVDLFGQPLSTMRDLSSKIGGALVGLHDRGVPDLVCHYHYLGAVGKALFDEAYSRLRRMLRCYRLRPDLHLLLRDLRGYGDASQDDGRFGPGRVRANLRALVLWILDDDSRKNLAYPFALPLYDFARRCLEAHDRFDAWVPFPHSRAERRALRHMESLSARLVRDPRIIDTNRELQARWQVFTELRGVLRLTEAELPGGDERRAQRPTPESGFHRLRRIEEAFDAFIVNMTKRAEGCDGRGSHARAEGIVLKYLKRYRGKLFGHPARRDHDGTIIAVVPRTDNPPEHLFGRRKQALRRRVGRAHLGRDLQQQPAQVMLTDNLRDPVYIRVVCGSLQNLPAAFAALDPANVDQPTLVRDHRDSALIRRVRALLKEPDTSLRPLEIESSVPSATAV